MNKKGIIIIILILAMVGIVAGAYYLFIGNSVDVSVGEHEVLVLCVDPSEKRPGLGAVDMAYIVTMNDGKVTNKTPLYPHDMVHPTAPVPTYLKNLGETKLRLHDSFWENDTEKDAKLAQEIVEYNTGIKTDIVLVVTPEAVNAVINAIGPISVPGSGQVTGSSIQWLRENQEGGVTRGDAVGSVMSAIFNATNDKSKMLILLNVGINQYNAGNIYVFPKGAFSKFLISEGIHRTIN